MQYVLDKAGGIILPDFRQYYKAIVIKTVWYCTQKQTYGSMEQNRDPRNKPTCLQSINLQQRRQEHTMENSLFSKWCWESWTATCKSMKLEHSLTPHTKINSKRLKDLNRRHDTVKLLEENIGKHSQIYIVPMFSSLSLPRQKK